MRYTVKPVSSFAVYDGDRIVETYESEKTAECVAEALNNEARIGRPVYAGDLANTTFNSGDAQ